jgi:hypothetical protein
MVFGAGREESRMWGTFIRACTGPEVFGEEYQQVVQQFDASDFAPMVTAPTLIVSHEGIAFITIEMARDLAARIPNSQLLVIPGTWADDMIATARLMLSFLNDDAAGPQPEPVAAPAQRVAIRTVLFTDLVGHSEMMSRLGDERGRDVLREHERHRG